MNKFLNEILEQPASLQDTFEFYENDPGINLLEKTLNLFKSKKFTEIIFTGMGSSYFTSYLTSCLLNEYGIRSYAINASELLHYHFSLLTPDVLLVCVSQSGESYEVVKILEKLKPDIGRGPSYSSVLQGALMFKEAVDDEYLFAISGIIPLQFIVNSRALDIGLQPGYFTRGAKITKVE